MNLSGEAIREALRYNEIEADHCLVIYDDIDLPVGKIRIRRTGGTGTHNGMRSILDALQHTDFPRIRIGIGPKPERWDLADYVLSHVAPDMEEPGGKAFCGLPTPWIQSSRKAWMRRSAAASVNVIQETVCKRRYLI
jgi:aminoacyl-tRNA hydrolase